MTTLKNILKSIDHVAIHGPQEVEVTGLCINSKDAKEGDCFIAIKGTNTDSHRFLPEVIAKNIKAVVVIDLPEVLDENVTYVQVSDTAKVLGILAANFYQHPSMKMKVVGVTGTNGKTTVATLLYKLFSGLGYKCGLISTVKNLIGDKELQATHTTPNAIALQALMQKMADAACRFVFMEVSSHAIHQHRIGGINFAGALFTNITHDHLDYHGTFDEYIRVKKMFFDQLPPTAFAISNLDDKRGKVMLQNTAATKKYFSLHQLSDFKGKILENNLSGLLMKVNNTEVHFRIVGAFNASNLLLVFGAAICLDEDRMEVLQILSQLDGAEGRFETFLSPKEKILGIVDYAHTPDALLNVLATINQMREDAQQVITVVGCGGDRDKAKRPIMGQVACEHSTRAIFTSDNPRSENPDAIIDEMEAELTFGQRKKILRMTNRQEAIHTACAMANGGDIVLVAGKGHENYQEIQGVKHPFDDKKILGEAFQKLDK